MLSGFFDVKDRNTSCAAVDQVDYFVEMTRERVDVLSIERRDESPVDPVDSIMGQVVSLVLQRFDLGDVLVELLRVLEKLVKQRGRAGHPAGYLREEVVELLVPRNDLHGSLQMVLPVEACFLGGGIYAGRVVRATVTQLPSQQECNKRKTTK